MLVKLKEPKKVFWEQHQKVCLSGKDVFDVRSSLHIRQLVNDGHLVEVEKASDKELSPQAKAKKTARVEAEKAEQVAADKAEFDAADAKVMAEAKAKAEADAKKEPKKDEPKK